MTLKELGELIINNPKSSDFTVKRGIIELDDDISDYSHLSIEDGEFIEIQTYYSNNIEILS